LDERPADPCRNAPFRRGPAGGPARAVPDRRVRARPRRGCRSQPSSARIRLTSQSTNSEEIMATIEQGTATGVSFALSDEQKSLRDLAREFAAKEIRPREAECDDTMQHP